MKTILTFLFLLIISSAFAQSNYAKDDNDNGTSMMPIFNKAKNLINTLETKNKLEIVKMEFDIVTSVKKVTWRTLAKDVNYSIVSFGDYRVKDIDISVFKSVNGTWTRVAKDKKEDSFALVTVKPNKTEMYKIEISVYQFKDKYNAAHYGLFFVR